MRIAYPQGATPIDPDEMEGLKLTHITTREELNRWEQENITSAAEWCSSRVHDDMISIKFVLKLHEKMFGDVWKWAGKFRLSDKNIGVFAWQIQSELKKLLDDFEAWREHGSYSNDEMAARFHHRLVYIHPFANGNGRHARMMTDMILKQVLKEKEFTWGSVDLSQTGDIRKRYIEALQAADKNDYSLLLRFVRT